MRRAAFGVVAAALVTGSAAWAQPLACGPTNRGRANAARSGCDCRAGFRQELYLGAWRCRPAPPRPTPPRTAPPATAPPATAEAAPPALPEYERITAGLRLRVYFDLARATIQPRSYPLLARAVEFLRDGANAGRRFEVSGHTDNRGSAALNQQLSQERAEAVVAYLVAHGVEAARLSARGYGPDRPLAPNLTEVNRARNRRIEITAR